IILSALLFAPANALALSDLDTKFWIQAHRQGQEQHLQCDLLTISSETLFCKNEELDDRIPLSHIKQLDVEYMGKLYIISDISTSDINSVNIMSAKKQEAFSAQQNNRQERPRIVSTEGVDINTGLPSERTSEMFQQQSSRQKITAVSAKNPTEKKYQAEYEILTGHDWELPVETASPGTVWIISVLIAWIIGLTPPLLIRFLVIKRPISKGEAIGTVATLWFLNIMIFTALGSKSKTHGGLVLIAWASYVILRKSNKNKTSSDSSCNEHVNQDVELEPRSEDVEFEPISEDVESEEQKKAYDFDNEVEMTISPNLPNITKCDPIKWFNIGDYSAVIVKDAPNIADTPGLIEYLYVMALCSKSASIPLCYVTAEKSFTGSVFLCTFDQQGNIHSNYGDDSDWSNINTFAKEAFSILKSEVSRLDDDNIAQQRA
ncbi:MAG: hypothetical protein D3922_06355, partial [Candidatus Electrothrix sp. AR1]|nr:hypothetical protein [Candidatus Electrothrix sp. AR1]